MLVRLWHGRTARASADRYLQFLHERAIPDYQSVPGNRGVHILRRVEDDVCHFLIVTLWDSLVAIQGFAGVDIEQAKYYPEDQDFLLEFEPTVTHYELAAQAGGRFMPD